MTSSCPQTSVRTVCVHVCVWPSGLHPSCAQEERVEGGRNTGFAGFLGGRG